ncbi:protein kinase, partial [Achlya hypogyna]
TPLHVAVRCDQRRLLELLLRANGVQFTVRNKRGDTPLIAAIRQGHRRFAQQIYTASAEPASEVAATEIAVNREAVLGRGGFGIVYEGRFNNQQVAVKTVFDPSAADALIHEMEAMQLCKSPYLMQLVALTDFGVSRTATTETMTMGVGTYRWMAPEILQDCHYSTAADVYSFGVILTELATHRIPYYDLCNDKGVPLADTAIISRVVRGEVQPSIPPASCPPWVRELALDCLAREPKARPTAMRISYLIFSQLHMPCARTSSHSAPGCFV